MKNHENRDRIDAFISRCSEHNLKVTPQRVSIYKIIFQSTSHPTADEIFQAIKKDFQNITFDTVNRTLLTFSGMGIIDVIVSYQGARRFDPNLENHHHFHCIQCGKIFDFSCEEFDRLKISTKIQQQFDILSKRVVLSGFCKACKKSK